MAGRKRVVKLKRTSELTEAEWELELRHIDDQLVHILDVFNFLEELSRLSNESEVALGAFNATPLFWHVFRDSLQESRFIGLGRLCDSSSDAVDVRRVLRGAMDHPEFFSAEALRRRVTERGLTESLADHLVASAWVPGSGADFRFLKKAVISHLDRIEKIYSPIRDCYYGHRLLGIDTRAMFERTNRKELAETLDVLRQLIAGLHFYHQNGVKPKVDVLGAKALDLQSRSYFRDVVRALAGREL